MKATWLDLAIGYLAPRLGLRRMRARVALEALANLRHYEAASIGRRTQGWNRSSGDANLVSGPFLSRLRESARDLVRNNGHADGALTTIADHVVGWGIVAKPKKKNEKALELWDAWAGTTACDSDGRNDFYGLEKLVMRTVAESGEVLVRRRIRRPEDNLPIPMQLQVMEPDYIDTEKTETSSVNGRRIVHGVEYDALGRRAAYWLFPEHPGSQTATGMASRAVPAESILHVFKQQRPGQVRGVPWLANVLLRFKDFDEYEDATLMKQKIAACLAVVTVDADGTAPPLGTADTSQNPEWDSLEPGMIKRLGPGESISVVQPPVVREYAEYSKASLRAIATGLGIPYEDLTGDYSDFNFSSARMSRLRHWDRVEDWRWRTLIPQFCDPVWTWAMEVAQVMGLKEAPTAEWTPPPMPMIEPDKEGLAISRNIRNLVTTWSESVRERGRDPEVVAKEMAEDNKRFDELGLILDCDPRNTTQAGQPREVAQPAPEPEPTPKPPEGEDDKDDKKEEEEKRHGRAPRNSRQPRAGARSRKP